jgi:hypothetical protein
MGSPARRRAPFGILAGLLAGVVLLGFPCRSTITAQEQHKPRIPGIDKITSGGSSRQAFSGIVKSVDLRSEVLNVDTVQGNTTEIFPIKKKTEVSTADGDRLKLARLKPGTSVLIYYEQKGDHKTVTQIVVLAGAGKKKTPPL